MKKRFKWRNIILFILIIISSITLIISIINIVKWKFYSNKTSHKIEDIQSNIDISELFDSDSTEIIGEEVDEDDPYWDYIKMNLIDVDFSELKEKNNQTVGWIQVKGTNINYPFVQTSDNSYYLTHTFDKSYNEAGWVFMDYRNNKDDYDKNTIIYAHGRYDNTMFGTLRNVLNNGWLNNQGNHVIKLSTEEENTLWQVFSVYRIPTTNDYIQVEFYNNEFKNFSNMLLERSAHDFNTSVSEDDKILTLSTCYNDNDKVVLHAKLIKREKK